MEWKSTLVEPKPGTKLIALYDDGSGGVLMLRDDAGDYYDENLEAENFNPERFSIWTELPDDFQLWFEHHEPE